LGGQRFAENSHLARSGGPLTLGWGTREWLQKGAKDREGMVDQREMDLRSKLRRDQDYGTGEEWSISLL
jgi:hypothetical protein